MVRTDSALQRLVAVVQYSDDAVVTKDLDGIIESWNPAAERIFGYTAEEMIGRSIRTIIPDDRQDEEDRVVARIRAGEVVGHYETLRKRKDGTLVEVSLTVSPIRTEAGEIIGAAKIARDLSESRIIEREALQLAAIVASSDDAIVSKDLNGTVQSWNQAAEHMFGYTAKEAIGRPIAALIIPKDRQNEETEVLTRIRAGERVDHFSTVRRRKDGTLIEVSITVSPVKNKLGQIIGASKIARDVTERNRLIRDLAQASRMKDEFLATLSHELRTPLNAIMGYARIISERVEDEAAKKAAEVIERNSKLLTQLVSDVLDMSAVTAGKTRLEMQVVNLNDVIEESLMVVAPAARGKGVTILKDLPEGAVEIAADPRRIQQVLWNLLSNAVKFTRAGGSVSVRLLVHPDSAVITVTDTGIGIDPAFLPRMFDRFSQGETGATREFGGIGIGLALVRHFVELHGGTVAAHSGGRGKGATFQVILPRRPEDVNGSS
jgi:PAS domain S-box-containing protein